MANPTCETCLYWRLPEPLPEQFNQGPALDGDDFPIRNECRRHSPVVHPEANPDAVWPLTAANDWCGDHQPSSD